MKQFIHKARKPDETVSKIRSLLSELGIFPVEKWYNFSDNSFSVRISDINNEDVGSNGKGITRSYALASAYGEFMERLQNRMLIRHEYGLYNDRRNEYPDFKIRAFGDVYDEFSSLPLLKDFSREDAKRPELCKSKCFPYYNFTKKRVAYLPGSLLSSYCGTNGMCAGNTPEEAILQGVCEIFERHSAMQLFTGREGVPQIPVSEIKSPLLRATIMEIQKKGYRVIIKDCTLGGKFPVIATLLFNRNNTRYKISFASDPVFDVALSRSITEISQGSSPDVFERTMQPAPWLNSAFEFNELPEAKRLLSMRQFFCNGQAPYQSFFLHDSGPAKHQKAFRDEVKDYRKTLLWAISLIHKAGLELYVRDVSYLGLPAYRIYVPGMSEVFALTREEALIPLSSPKKTLLNFKGASEDELRILAENIEARLNIPSKGTQAFFNQLSRLDLNRRSDLAAFSPRSFLALIYLRLKDYKKAFRYLQEDSANMSPDDIGAYKSAMLAILKFKNDGYSEEDIEATLKPIFGEKIAAHMLEYLRSPVKIFDNYNLPACGNCENCGVKRDCRVNYWENIETKIWKKMLKYPIDQEKSLARLAP
ncbi:MAG: YcaO-like family protein [Elusimicrobiales bacterium]